MRTDEDLIRGAAAKDQSAFEEMVSRYQALVYNTCLGLTGDPVQAQDAAQEVFLQLYRKASSFRFESRVSTWIYRITVNTTLNWLRRQRKFRLFRTFDAVPNGEPMQDAVAEADRTDSPEAAWELKEKKDLLLRSIAALTPEQRIVLVLNKLEGLTTGEIAEILGVSHGVVEGRLHRAKKSLQKKILSRLI
jgi:RNA polymerase sigma-70 factor (ECF subfamily)